MKYCPVPGSHCEDCHLDPTDCGRKPGTVHLEQDLAATKKQLNDLLNLFADLVDDLEAIGSGSSSDWRDRKSVVKARAYVAQMVRTQYDQAKEDPRPLLCDGCNVREPWEHRCHRGPPISVRGETVHAQCECEECREDREAA